MLRWKEKVAHMIKVLMNYFFNIKYVKIKKEIDLLLFSLVYLRGIFSGDAFYLHLQ